MALRRPETVTQRYANTLVTDSTVYGVTLREMKTHLRIIEDEEDEYLTELIWQTTKWLEDYHSIAFFNQTWKLSLDAWPGYGEQWWDGVRELPVTELAGRGKAIILPRYPLSSITSMTVYDESSNATAITPSDYFDIDTQSKRGRMKLKFGKTFPIATRSLNAIEIVYVAGYGSVSTQLPVGLKRGLMEMVAYMYNHRGDCTCGEAYSKSAAEMSIRAYVVKRF